MSAEPTTIRDTIERVLRNIAPEADFAALNPVEPLRDQLDIDSFDFLRFIIGLHEALGVDIPETDYPQLMTMAQAIDYLNATIGPYTDHG
jgi:acyl carrier protein